MNCRKAIRQLPAYLDDELSQQQVSALERHLEACVFCSTELASLRATSKMLDRWEDISPRRCPIDTVIGRIRAEESGASDRGGVGVRLHPRRWCFAAVRAAGIAIFLLGVAVFSARTPVVDRLAQESRTDNRVDDFQSARALLAVDENLIKPSEYPLVLTGMHHGVPAMTVSSGDVAVRPSVEGSWFFDGTTFPEVNHVYFPSKGMAVESVIPVTMR